VLVCPIKEIVAGFRICAIDLLHTVDVCVNKCERTLSKNTHRTIHDALRLGSAIAIGQRFEEGEVLWLDGSSSGASVVRMPLLGVPPCRYDVKSTLKSLVTRGMGWVG
jgi:hypothetical protein